MNYALLPLVSIKSPVVVKPFLLFKSAVKSNFPPKESFTKSFARVESLQRQNLRFFLWELVGGKER